MSLVSFALMLLATQAVPPFTTEDQRELVQTFTDICVSTNLDRSRFDAKISGNPGFVKLSSPFSWGGGFNRRWKNGATELGYLDAPAPAGLSCGMERFIPAESDIKGIVERLAAISDLSFQRVITDNNNAGYEVWQARRSDGGVLTVNKLYNRIELIFAKARSPMQGISVRNDAKAPPVSALDEAIECRSSSRVALRMSGASSKFTETAKLMERYWSRQLRVLARAEGATSGEIERREILNGFNGVGNDFAVVMRHCFDQLPQMRGKR